MEEGIKKLARRAIASINRTPKTFFNYKTEEIHVQYPTMSDKVVIECEEKLACGHSVWLNEHDYVQLGQSRDILDIVNCEGCRESLEACCLL